MASTDPFDCDSRSPEPFRIAAGRQSSSTFAPQPSPSSVRRSNAPDDDDDPFLAASSSVPRFTTTATAAAGKHVTGGGGTPVAANHRQTASMGTPQPTPNGRSDPPTPRPTQQLPLGPTSSQTLASAVPLHVDPQAAAPSDGLPSGNLSPSRSAGSYAGPGGPAAPGAAQPSTPTKPPTDGGGSSSTLPDTEHATPRDPLDESTNSASRSLTGEGGSPSAAAAAGTAAAGGSAPSTAAAVLPKRGWFDRHFRPTQFDAVEKQADEGFEAIIKEEKIQYQSFRPQFKLFQNWTHSMLRQHGKELQSLTEKETKARESSVEKEEKEERSKVEKAAAKALKALPASAKLPATASASSSSTIAAADGSSIHAAAASAPPPPTQTHSSDEQPVAGKVLPTDPSADDGPMQGSAAAASAST